MIEWVDTALAVGVVLAEVEPHLTLNRATNDGEARSP